ncbi:TetR/AcrR family transcriptional regulator [Streptomyces roseicoloratus]|uniref:TetR/AcrR family transcriptional regulator n=1 Tax=Streptomyces roseicoloratus TaxID=2508722 RepID=UPI001009D415|nr:TetR/AcrR family transcriptional regulator [Streptomyces roseicoloratus]
MTDETRTPGRSGGPRRRDEIFAACLGLLAEHGYDQLTIEGVAQRADVNKTTIYRWWPSKSELLRDALLTSGLLAFDLPDTGSLAGDLAALGTRVQDLLADDHKRAVVESALVGAVRHPAMRELVSSFLEDRLGRHQPIFVRAVTRGELPADFDPALLVDALAGALWLRVLVRRRGVTEGFAEQLVTLLMNGAGAEARPAATRTPAVTHTPAAGTAPGGAG